MTMRVAIVNPVVGADGAHSEETLHRFRSLTGWAGAIAAAGAPSLSTSDSHRRTRSRLRGCSIRLCVMGRSRSLRRGTTRGMAGLLAAEPDLVHVNGVIFPGGCAADGRCRHLSAWWCRIMAVGIAIASMWSRLWIGRGLSAMDAVLLSSPGHIEAWRSASMVPSGVEFADVMEASTDLQPMPSGDAASLSGVWPAIRRSSGWSRLTPNKDPLTMLEGCAVVGGVPGCRAEPGV